MRNFLGGDFTFQKYIYIFLGDFFKKKFERGVEMEDPKNAWMEMDDPKMLVRFARKYPRIPYFCLFFAIFFWEGDFFLIPYRRHFYGGKTCIYTYFSILVENV